MNANSRPRCILSLHSNCWAEIATLAESELAQKKRFPDPGREYSDALDREAAYSDIPEDWEWELKRVGLPEHLTKHRTSASSCPATRPPSR